jgi:hypothetical protein
VVLLRHRGLLHVRPLPQGQGHRPRPLTRDPQPATLNNTPHTLDPRPSTLDPRPSTLNPGPSTLSLYPWTVALQVATQIAVDPSTGAFGLFLLAHHSLMSYLGEAAGRGLREGCTPGPRGPGAGYRVLDLGLACVAEDAPPPQCVPYRATALYGALRRCDACGGYRGPGIRCGARLKSKP